jgi:hypothetical protein
MFQSSDLFFSSALSAGAILSGFCGTFLAAMRQYATAASEPKLVLWYDTGHGLNDIGPLIDRANWLHRHIGMKSVAPLLRSRISN